MFNYSHAIHHLIEDIVRFSPPMSHIIPKSLIVCLSQARSPQRYGLYAKITPMRFEGGSRFTTKGRRTYEVERLWFEGYEIMYLVHFVLPRFQNLTFKEKMTTLFHELYHIHPSFNGDIRRFPGANYAHSSSKEDFDAAAKQLAQNYLNQTPNRELSEFFNLKFKHLEQKKGRIIGRKVPIPKLKVVRPETYLQPNGQYVLAM